MNNSHNPFESPRSEARVVRATLAEVDGRLVYPFASGRTRARWAMTLLALGIVTYVVGAALCYRETRLLAWLRPLVSVESILDSDEQVRANLIAQFVNWSAQMAIFVATAVAFMMWHHRVYRNLPSLGAADVWFSPGWAVGHWFIPIISLFRPYQTIAEVWRKSHPAPLREGQSYTPMRDGVAYDEFAVGAALVGWWWALWIATLVTYRGAYRLSVYAPTIEKTVAADWISIAGDLIVTLDAILAILVIRGIDRHQEERFSLLQRAKRAEDAGPTAHGPSAP